METRISLITLGVADLERAVRFYRDGLGWPHSRVGAGAVAFFRRQNECVKDEWCDELVYVILAEEWDV